MLDKNAIAAAVKDAARPLARRHQNVPASMTGCGRATARRPTRSRRQSNNIRPSDLFGWKIAATSEAGQKHINVDGPMAGRILAETVIADGGTASMAGNEMRVTEPEFAFRMRVDLPARADALYGAAGARRGRHAASGDRDSGSRDLPTSSAPAPPRRSLPTTPARICSCWDRRQRGLAFTRSRSRNGRHARCAASNSSVAARTCWAIPRVALTWLANELRQLRRDAEPAKIVTTGTCHPPLPIQSGDFCAVRFRFARERCRWGSRHAVFHVIASRTLTIDIARSSLSPDRWR